MNSKEDNKLLKTLRKHWEKSAEVTDMYQSNDCEKVADENLLPGEVEAVTFQVGCYTVRSASRIYKVCKPNMETPANEEPDELRRIKDSISVLMPIYNNTFRLTHEISARHNSNPDGDFTYICRAATGRTWWELIGDICTAKKKKSVSDEEAHLFVSMSWTGSSHGANTWYKLDPNGNIETLYLNSLNPDMENARFTAIK